MELSLSNLKLAKGSRKKRRRVGRGNASGRGTYSGRGQKGQRSRSGGKSGLKMKGLRQFLKNKPKIGGFKSLGSKMAIININQLERCFEPGEVVDTKKLLTRNLIKTIKSGVKILGEGKLTKKLTVIADAFSKSAKKAIMEAGGNVQLKTKSPKPKSKKLESKANKTRGR